MMTSAEIPCEWSERLPLTEDVIVDTLSAQDKCSEKDTRFTECHESHEVHSLILGLLEKGMNPTPVPFLFAIRSIGNKNLITREIITIRRKLCKWRMVAATIPGIPAIVSRNRMRYTAIAERKRTATRTCLANAAYVHPFLFIHDVAFLA